MKFRIIQKFQDSARGDSGYRHFGQLSALLDHVQAVRAAHSHLLFFFTAGNELPSELFISASQLSVLLGEEGVCCVQSTTYSEAAESDLTTARTASELLMTIRLLEAVHRTKEPPCAAYSELGDLASGLEAARNDPQALVPLLGSTAASLHAW
jgi:hypothetical protein